MTVGKAVKRRRKHNEGSTRRWQHSRAWTLSGTIRLAFSALGGGAAPSQKQTCRDIDAVAAVALAQQHYVRSQAACTKMLIEFGSLRLSWVMVECALDATPLKIRFGKLRSLLAPCA